MAQKLASAEEDLAGQLEKLADAREKLERDRSMMPPHQGVWGNDGGDLVQRLPSKELGLRGKAARLVVG